MKIEDAILSLVQMHPGVTGYELKTIVDMSTGKTIRLHLSRIYPALSKLTQEGYLKCEHENEEGKIEKKYYWITPKGEERLNESLSQPFEFNPSSSTFNDYLLHLSCMAYMDNETIRNFIDDGIAWVTGKLEYMENERTAIEENYVEDLSDPMKSRYLQLWAREKEFSIAESKLELEWLRKLRKDYE